LHSAWSRMLVFKELSKIHKQKNKTITNKISYPVNMENKKVFEEFKKLIPNITGYIRLYIKLFNDISEFDFPSCSSVTDKHFSQNALYADIELFEHTLNVFYEMLNIVDSDDYASNKDILLLIALLHDFGKSHELCNLYNIDLENSHCIRSAKYFEQIVRADKLEYLLDDTSFSIIYNTLYNHHNIIESDTTPTIFLNALIQADANARALELKKITLLQAGKNDS